MAIKSGAAPSTQPHDWLVFRRIPCQEKCGVSGSLKPPNVLKSRKCHIWGRLTNSSSQSLVEIHLLKRPAKCPKFVNRIHCCTSLHFTPYIACIDRNFLVSKLLDFRVLRPGCLYFSMWCDAAHLTMIRSTIALALLLCACAKYVIVTVLHVACFYGNTVFFKQNQQKAERLCLIFNQVVLFTEDAFFV